MPPSRALPPSTAVIPHRSCSAGLPNAALPSSPRARAKILWHPTWLRSSSTSPRRTLPLSPASTGVSASTSLPTYVHNLLHPIFLPHKLTCRARSTSPPSFSGSSVKHHVSKNKGRVPGNPLLCNCLGLNEGWTALPGTHHVRWITQLYPHSWILSDGRKFGGSLECELGQFMRRGYGREYRVTPG